MNALADLAHSFKMGMLPSGLGVDPLALHRMGEELAELVDRAPGGEEALDDMERIRELLVNFGALTADDLTTGLADVLENLLPPAQGE